MRRRYGRSLGLWLGLALLVGLVAVPTAQAEHPHFTRVDVALIQTAPQVGFLLFKFQEQGVDPNTPVNYYGQADATAIWQCLQTKTRQEVSQKVSAAITEKPAQGRRVTNLVVAPPPPPTGFCPSGPVALAAIVYDDLLLADLTNNVFDDHIRGGRISGIFIHP